LDKLLAEWVDFDQARIASLVEFAEFLDKTNISLLDILVRIRADNAARNGTEKSDA
jgi:hypothetical protein